MYKAGVSGGSIARCVTMEVKVACSDPARDAFLQIDRPKALERESAKLDAKDFAQSSSIQAISEGSSGREGKGGRIGRTTATGLGWQC